MNSIRPLITITILVVVGVFLYIGINKGPARPQHGLAGGHQATTPPGIPQIDLPPLGAPERAPSSGIATAPPSAPASSNASLAPQWPGPAASPPSPPSNQTAGPTLPPMPAMPALPDFPALPSAAPPTSNATSGLGSAPPSGLPSDIPVARYPGDPQTNALPNAPGAGGAAQPPLAPSPTSPPRTERDVAVDDAMRSLGLTAGPPATNGGTDASRSGATGTPSATLNVTPPPIAPSTAAPPATSSAAPPSGGRYGATPVDASMNAPVTTTPPTVDAPAATQPSPGASFAGYWPTIQAALDRNELVRAHLLLSQWYGEPTLTPAEAERVDTLLGQLAGTVIYSTEHRLAPPHMVRPGENLESIAKQYDASSALLAKINGVAAPGDVRPGQQLKIVPGPFAAVLDLRRSQLTLTLEKRYAGRFSVSPLAAVPEGEWILADKVATPGSQSIYGASPMSGPTVARKLLLRSASSPDGRGGSIEIGSKASLEAPRPTAGPADLPQIVTFPVAVSAADAEDLCDILSIGSRVTIRR